MSNFRSKAFNPVSKKIEDAEYCDDYYGRHRYGIRFDDGCVHPESQCGIDAAATQLDALQAWCSELEARALRAEQERDEAYERTAKVCDAWPEQIHDVMEHDGSPVSATSCAKSLADRIRRLAAGPEKEG